MNYIIYLPEYRNSIELAQRAQLSAQNHGWDIKLYAGVDGKLRGWDTVQPNISDAKCRAMLERPGVRGCFFSHWNLWNLCVEQNQTIGIFEHDTVFCGPPPKSVEFKHVYKMEGFLKKKSRPAGEWYEGARAYLLSPLGAGRLIDWVNQHGALPADVNIGLDIVDIVLDTQQRIVPHALYGKSQKRNNSFTWNLEGMK